MVEQADPKTRTEIMALMTALQYAGFTVSPVIGSSLAHVGQNISTYWQYGLPAYFIMLMSLYCVIALLVEFKNLPTATAETMEKATGTNGENGKGDKKGKGADSSVVLFIIVVMILLNVTTKGSIAVYETLGSQIATADYGMSTNAMGLLITSAGGVGFVQLLMFKVFWTKYFNDFELMLGGIAVMMVAQLIMLQYTTAQPSFLRYLASVVLMYAIGYPIGHTAVLGAFSKIQKSGENSFIS